MTRDLQSIIADDFFKKTNKDGFRKPEKKRKIKRVKLIPIKKEE